MCKDSLLPGKQLGWFIDCVCVCSLVYYAGVSFLSNAFAAARIFQLIAEPEQSLSLFLLPSTSEVMNGLKRGKRWN